MSDFDVASEMALRLCGVVLGLMGAGLVMVWIAAPLVGAPLTVCVVGYLLYRALHPGGER